MFRVKKLDIFISKQFGLLFVATFFICQFVLMMQFLWRYIDELIGKGLSMEVMAQFFWYMSLMLVPQALPLAILLSSLITFGNLGESSELTAIKSAGISLMQTFRPLIIISILITAVSFFFQNDIGPKANMKMTQLLISMKQKSPELEIPEGIFYDGIPNCNLYVQKKNMKTGKLYGIMIYRMTGSYEDQEIILADSGMLQATAEKKHLVLSLWDGMWYGNLQAELGRTAAVPYQRQAFVTKKLVLDYDGDFNLTDATTLSNNARGKSLAQIFHDKDSMVQIYDSIGLQFYKSAKARYYRLHDVSKKDSLLALKRAGEKTYRLDSAYAKLSNEDKQNVVNIALGNVRSESSELTFNAMMTSDGDKIIRQHDIEAINKFTLALSCLIFFFIGAPLGAIIRKGGLGVPVIVSVLVFIIYYIFDNTGFRMAREGQWTVWFGMTISTVALTPIAAFFTYKANKDSVVFNMDLYKSLIIRLLGLRTKRHIYRKEVIIEDPDYQTDANMLADINRQIAEYSENHKLLHWPNPVKVFFHAGDDQEIEEINERLEETIENLSYTKDRLILTELNHYPILATHSHTRPFRKKWMNVVTGLLLPVGLFFYIRMLRFRFRLYKDLRTIRNTSGRIIPKAEELARR